MRCASQVAPQPRERAARVFGALDLWPIGRGPPGPRAQNSGGGSGARAALRLAFDLAP